MRRPDLKLLQQIAFLVISGYSHEKVLVSFHES